MGHLKAKVGVRGVKAMELYTTLNHLHCYNEHVLISNLEKKKKKQPDKIFCFKSQ